MSNVLHVRRNLSPFVAIVVAMSLLAWTTGLPFWIQYVRAAVLTSLKDTLSDSRPSTLSRHTINFTTTNAVTAGQTIKIQLDPTGDAFSQAFSSATTTDITTTGMTLVATCGGGTDEVTVLADYTAPDENITFTVCSGDTVGAGAKTVTVGAASTNLWTNPATVGSYIIRFGGTMTDSGDLRVAIVDAVTVTATVDTILNFLISGVASGQSINGDSVTTSAGASTTTLPFGTLSPTSPKVLAQTLAVTTNARNGFSVTVVQNQNLTSANGADIDAFKDGSGVLGPVAWTSPTAVLDSENTYGHIGLTSEDADLNSDEFGTALYAAIGTSTPRTVFSHTGPADGATANKGSTRVGYKVEISSLQEAGNDYTNRLTYVATPTF